MNAGESILMSMDTGALDTNETTHYNYGLTMTVNDCKSFMSVCKSLDEIKENMIDNLVEEFKHLNLEKIEKLDENYKITYNVLDCDYDEYELFQPWDLYDIFNIVKLKLYKIKSMNL